MSTDTEHVEDDGAETAPSLLETWADWYHIPVIGAVMLFMFWVRTQAYGRFVTEDGTPALGGVDSWYHWRTVEWTAENYPNTMPYEIWTGFPTGNYVGQFGTLFDQIIVTIAMIVGLGDPSTSTLYTVALLTVPAMAALVAIPVFSIGRRLGGTVGGLVSVVILALVPGSFLARTTVGQLQHHVAEVLFMAIAVLSMMVALRVAEREQPIYELVVDKDWETLREPAIYSVLAGIALSLYIWVWPPGVVLVGILAIFFTIQLCLEYLRGISPDHTAFVGALSLGVTTLVTVVLIEEPGTSVTSFGYIQPISAALVAGGCLFMAWLARQWNNYDIDRRYYPGAVAGLIGVAFLAMWLVLPDLFSTIVNNATRRVVPFGTTGTDLTISEAQPPADFTSHVFNEFGAAFYTMLAGLALLIARPFLGREYRAEYTLIIVWSAFLISMAATQLRFAYYLVLAVAVVNAVFVADIVRIFDLDIRGGVDSLRQVETYQIIVLVLVVMLLFAPLLPPIASSTDTAWDRGERVGPHQEAMVWEESNHWLADNTPEPGDWGGADNASDLEYYGTYDYPDGGDHEYPVGAYGVMSWWDYGHLITTQAERIPHSNPFQQNARSSSAFLTAESEQRGELILDAIAAGEDPRGTDVHTNEDLEAMAADPTHEEMRYVMIDYAMAGGKFPAITQWTGPEYTHYMTPEDYQPGQPLHSDELAETFGEMPYHDTMLSQLYFDDADGMEHYRVVHENEGAGTAIFASYAQVFAEEAFPEQTVQQLDAWGYEDGDVLYVQDGDIAPPGEGQLAVQVNERVGQERLLQLDQQPTTELFGVNDAAAVKTFERVEGATLSGTVDDEDDLLEEDATITATVDLETNAERTFTYTQEVELADDGSFELVVPYATDDELGVEDGYTNSSVEAVDGYTLTVGESGEQGYEAQTAVPETAVIQGELIDDIEFEQTELEESDDADDEDGIEDVDGDELDEGTADTDAGEEPGDDDADVAGAVTPAAMQMAG
ncbi:oligosaccharyl transferase, archaeosortase A system-associated [Natronorubrum sulfidifaciens]|uniref:dolichyl-phosphooligosaccharide-protein glycotransferase n=1 Tax=Natronorubrum sulfidifaciens JCM 14089 TaxID=1230460 RepID=L9WJ89_9EURY|nr:oligosaccharyl transferase, archaeosortase A system-associated [Natronorubrum sulfidifaciens]ELY48423.1 oligosaccharyl transferase STT3 subunit [Natronorubrum sulfidifaciens JCM 14089]